MVAVQELIDTPSVSLSVRRERFTAHADALREAGLFADDNAVLVDDAATLRAVFLSQDGDYRGARCELPGSEVIEVKGRRTPFFALCRELDKRGYGDCRIEISTPAGTPSMRAVVRVAAGLTIKERDRGGLRLERFQEFPGPLTDSQVELEGTSGPETPDRAPGPDRTTGEAA